MLKSSPLNLIDRTTLNDSSSPSSFGFCDAESSGQLRFKVRLRNRGRSGEAGFDETSDECYLNRNASWQDLSEPRTVFKKLNFKAYEWAQQASLSLESLSSPVLGPFASYEVTSYEENEVFVSTVPGLLNIYVGF